MSLRFHAKITKSNLKYKKCVQIATFCTVEEIILDDEKYFTLTNSKIMGNDGF